MSPRQICRGLISSGPCTSPSGSPPPSRPTPPPCRPRPDGTTSPAGVEPIAANTPSTIHEPCRTTTGPFLLCSGRQRAPEWPVRSAGTWPRPASHPSNRSIRCHTGVTPRKHATSGATQGAQHVRDHHQTNPPRGRAPAPCVLAAMLPASTGARPTAHRRRPAGAADPTRTGTAGPGTSPRTGTRPIAPAGPVADTRSGRSPVRAPVRGSSDPSRPGQRRVGRLLAGDRTRSTRCGRPTG